MPDEPDATRPIRPIPDDATRVNQPPASGAPGADATRVGLPPVAGPPGADPAAPRWTARAGVPQPGERELRRPAPEEWVEEDPYQGRSWLRPVIIGTVVAALVAVLGVGLVLIYRATGEGVTTEPSAVAPASASGSPVPSRTQRQSSAPPSSAAPPSSPPADEPAMVTVPRLRGATVGEATIKLQQLGLGVKTVRQADTSVQPGEVFQTIPGENELVEPGSVITLYVATDPSPAPSTSKS